MSDANPVNLRVEDTIAIITSDSPPVNAISARVCAGLHAAFLEATGKGVQAVVLNCAGRTFFAGADITEFGGPPYNPNLFDVIDIIENFPAPVVAAIHGTALGGGLEMALSAHYRVAAKAAKVGLPEVHLGILPGAGGTQRTPRLTGAARALDIITSGRQVGTKEALEIGLIDKVVADETLLADAIAFAKDVIAKGSARPKARDKTDWTQKDRAEKDLVANFLKTNGAKFRGFKAPQAICEAVQAAIDLPFDEGLKKENDLFKVLVETTESKAQRYYFFAEREAAKLPPELRDGESIPLTKIGVIGAGTMGSGIALAMLGGGLKVAMVEVAEAPLERGKKHMEGTIDSLAQRGRLSPEKAAAQKAAATYSLDFDVLADCDLIIEAVFEKMEIKKEIFARIDSIAKPGAILASNTSFLNVDEMAAVTKRPGDVVGLHFFSPANIMRLLEIVRGAKSSPNAIATSFALAKKIGKVGVMSGVCHGFIANRIFATRGEQCERISEEGTPLETIDKALLNYGFPMGHFQMMDLAGLDVLARSMTERTVMRDLFEMGRSGQKTKGGYYDYDDNRKPSHSDLVTKVIADFAAFKGIKQRAPMDEAAIIDRVLLPVVNEGAKVLGEGIALRASDVDVVAILGYGWPVYRGGPMFWAEQMGLKNVVAKLRALEAEHGPAFTPCDHLLQKAESGRF